MRVESVKTHLTIKKEDSKMKKTNNVKNATKIIIPRGHFNSDWFRCQKCGREVQMLVLGNHATCSKCGGMMVRK